MTAQFSTYDDAMAEITRLQMLQYEQAQEIARLKTLLAARPTEIMLHAATANAEHYRNLFEQADAARKTALVELAKVRKQKRSMNREFWDYIDWQQQRHNEAVE